VWRAPLVRLAAMSGVAVAVLAAASMSPLCRIRQVTWTGLESPDADCAVFESAVLGRSLFFLPEVALRQRMGLDKLPVELRLHRHFPATLEVKLEPRCAVAQIDGGVAVDAGGRALGDAHRLAGLPVLEGFALGAGGKRLARADRDILRTLLPLFRLPTLAPSRVRRGDSGELDLTLADSGARVRLDAESADSELLKLRVFEESLGSEPMPRDIDLRFEAQVVVRDEGRPHARQRPH